MDETRSKIVHVFKIGEWKETPERLEVKSTYIEQTPQSISVSMDKVLRDIKAIPVIPSRGKQIAAPLTQLETRNVISVIGKTDSVGVAVLPFCALAASYIQQMTPDMTIALT